MFNTRLTLKDRAKSRADADGSDFPSDAQWNFHLDEAAREVLGDLVLSGWPLEYDTTTIVTNGTTKSYSWGLELGGGIRPMAAIMVYTNYGGQQVELKRVNPGRAAFLRSSGANSGYSMYYEVRNSLTLGPIVEFFPRVGGTYFVDYIQDWPGFVSDGGNPVWMGPDRSDELLVIRAATKAVRKEGRATDGDRLDLEYDKLLVKVKDMASRFDMRNGAEMRDAPSIITDLWRGDMFAGPGGIF